jgi:hypothetical protein
MKFTKGLAIMIRGFPVPIIMESSHSISLHLKKKNKAIRPLTTLIINFFKVISLLDRTTSD